MSPFYVDLRVLVSHPQVLADVARAFLAELAQLQFDRIAALPYAALPIGVAVSLQAGFPLLYPRQEQHKTGTARLIEGEYAAGETVVVLDDVITTGASKLEALQPLRDAGLRVRDIVVLIDREQGGAEALRQAGLELHAVMTVTEVLRMLHKAGCVSSEQLEQALAFVQRSRQGAGG